MQEKNVAWRAFRWTLACSLGCRESRFACVACALSHSSRLERSRVSKQEPDLIKSAAGGTAQVSLSDCLACSGCVTSAEAVLIKQQSHEELLRALKAKVSQRSHVPGASKTRQALTCLAHCAHVQDHDAYIMSVSPQALASLAADAGLSMSEAIPRLTAFLQGLGVTSILDTSAGTDLALQLAGREFLPLLQASMPASVAAAAGSLAAAVGSTGATVAVPSIGTGAVPCAGGAVLATAEAGVLSLALASAGGGSGAAAPAAGAGHPAPRPAWRAPPFTLAISSTRTKIIPPGTLSAVNSSGDGAPLVNLDGGTSAAGVIVDSSTGQAVDVDGALVQLTGEAAAEAPRAAAIRQLCAEAGVPLPGLPSGVASTPVLASACPGWVCYAEKSHSAALAHISRVRSPQALVGEGVKASGGARVYHATLMPCFDKKLEASRKDMYTEEGAEGVKLVDCVVTPEEMLQLLQEQGHASLADVPTAGAQAPAGGPCAPLAPLHLASGLALQVPHPEEGQSGGYAGHILRHTVQASTGIRLEGPLPWVAGRNADQRTVRVEVGGQVLVEVGVANGFRNIQTILTRMKRGKHCPHYVEVMACGGGCPNGGGQARVRGGVDADGAVAKPSLTQQRERVQLVEGLLGGRPQQEAAAGARREALQAAVASNTTTSYHAMPDVGTSASVKW